MASIIHRKGRDRPWMAQVHRKGHGKFTKSFVLRREAELWAGEQERQIRLRGLPLTHDELKKVTVGELVDRYLKEVSPSKASHEIEKLILTAFQRRPMAKKTLAAISHLDAVNYRNERLQERWQSKGTKGPGRLIAPSTVRRQVTILSHMFEIARKEWGYANLVNPFAGLTIKGSSRRRKRRLQGDELGRLILATHACGNSVNRRFLPIAIWLAVETGMRLQEIFGLTWADLDLDKRRIEIQRSKTDYLKQYPGRTIVMTLAARALLQAAWRDHFQQTDRIFPMTRVGFKQTWDGVKKRAGIVGLTFHDLRHEAASRFDEAGLTRSEHNLMMGHDPGDMTSLYVHSDLQRIQDKLDAFDPSPYWSRELKSIRDAA